MGKRGPERRLGRAATRVLVAVICLAAALVALRFAGRAAPERPEGRLVAYAGIPPQACFVRKVAGGHVEVKVLVRPGQSPHTFEPTPREMAGLAEAELYFSTGIPFEKALLRKIAELHERLLVVDTSEGVTFIHSGQHDGHGDHGDHEGGRPDPHIWLDPLRVKQIAANIAGALVRYDPDHAEDYRTNLDAFGRELDELHAEISETLAPVKGREFFVYHPAFSYFAQVYGLREVVVETMGKEPGARRLAALVDEAKRKDAKVIFVQKQFSAAGARAIAEEIGAEIVPLDPLASDYVENLREVAFKIADALEAEAPS